MDRYMLPSVGQLEMNECDHESVNDRNWKIDDHFFVPQSPFSGDNEEQLFSSICNSKVPFPSYLPYSTTSYLTRVSQTTKCTLHCIPTTSGHKSPKMNSVYSCCIFISVVGERPKAQTGLHWGQRTHQTPSLLCRHRLGVARVSENGTTLQAQNSQWHDMHNVYDAVTLHRVTLSHGHTALTSSHTTLSYMITQLWLIFGLQSHSLVVAQLWVMFTQLWLVVT